MKHETIGGSQQGSNLDRDFLGWYNPEVKNMEDFSQMKPAEQLDYLSSAIEASKADTAYAFFEGFKIFKKIEDNNEFSPLIRIVAEVGRKMDVTDERYDEDNDIVLIEAGEFGYSSIVRPEMIPEGVLTPEEEMSEEELRSRISALEEKLSDEINDESTFWDTISKRNELELALDKLTFKKNQERLHEEFPFFPEDKQLVKIASDAVAVVEFQQKYDEDESWFSSSSSLQQITDSDGNTIIGPDKKSPYGLDKDAITCLVAIHNNARIKNAVEEKLGLSLTKMPLKAQAHLLKFMTEAGNKRFDNLCNVLHKVDDEKLRYALVENFVAADFGEDFGDSLLTIAGSERLTDGEKEKIFDMISSCRKSIEKITGLFEGFYGGRFAKQCARAANERLTDAIAAFGKIAKNGKVDIKLDLGGWANFNLSSALEALEYETKSLEIISGVIGDVANGEKGAYAMRIISPKTDNHSKFFSMYHLYSPDYGYVLLYTRSEASHSYTNSKEYGKRGNRYDKDSKAGVEASISFIVNPVDPKSMINPDKPSREAMKNKNYYDPSTMDKVSAFRLDREGRESGMPANDPNRDSINPRGMVSVDLAAILDRKDTPSGKIARLISAGGKIRELASGKKSSLNHNTNWFDHERYGSYEGFAKLVRYLDREVMKWCERESDKKIGKKALKAMMTESLKRRSVGAA